MTAQVSSNNKEGSQMIVYSTGLDENPETLVARARHTAVSTGNIQIIPQLDDMYDAIFARHNTEGQRLPYPFSEVVTDLVKLGVDVRDWTGATVQSIVPTTNRLLVDATFRSRITNGCKVVIQLPSAELAEWVVDLEASGLWLFGGYR